MPLRRMPGDVHSRNCELQRNQDARRGEGSDQAGCGKLGSALDQEHRELAERIQIDWSHVGRQSGDFKLQLELAQPFFWVGVVTFTKRSNCRYYWFGPGPIDRVVGNGDVWRIGLRQPVNDGAVLRQRNSERCRMRVPLSWSERSRDRLEPEESRSRASFGSSQPAAFAHLSAVWLSTHRGLPQAFHSKRRSTTLASFNKHWKVSNIDQRGTMPSWHTAATTAPCRHSSVTESSVVLRSDLTGGIYAQSPNVHFIASRDGAVSLSQMPVARGGPAHYCSTSRLRALDTEMHQMRPYPRGAGEHRPDEVRCYRLGAQRPESVAARTIT
jgi:hypothetical protein